MRGLHFFQFIGKKINFALFLFLLSNSYSQLDYKLAPNSYYFNPYQNDHDGFFIPVKKAYEMWANDIHIGGSVIPNGTEIAEVFWEDNHGLIKSNTDYTLEIVGTGENAKIKVPINKTKEGNAVIVYKVNNEIYWSWHVWVTDNPTNGTTYRSFETHPIHRTLNDNTLEEIPIDELRWMDRNLGALGEKLTGTNWNKAGGLLYQWGRKDPIPPLATKGDDFYEVSGSVGRVRHRHARNWNNGAVTIDTKKLYITNANSTVLNNIRESVKNPISLIYITNDNNSNQAFYGGNPNNPINWFGHSSTLPSNRLSELNLWSDNSKGIISITNYNFNSQRKPYNTKSSYDPCPNGWRIPSMLVANLGNYSYVDDVRTDYSPFGLATDTPNNTMNNDVLPADDNSTPTYKKGMKIYPLIGFDMSNVNGKNMGIFPGTGVIYRNKNLHDSQFTDQHETHLWTATMTRWWDASPSVSARSMRLIPDASQFVNNYQPDLVNYPDVWGLYRFYTSGGGETSNANACRCITDPLYIKNGYDFPTEYYTEVAPKYTKGMYEPNSYMKTKKEESQTIQIPINKAFSVQSQLLENPTILNQNNFNNLKVNVLWTSNTNLIESISLNSQPTSLTDIENAKILVTIKENQSGNAVVTLHNNSITDPIMWSWHIWITNSKVNSYFYQNQEPIVEATNYVNYIKKGFVLLTEFMDRNLGAIEDFPTVINPSDLTTEELNKIKNSGGLQYQWGRKDPIPSFTNPDGSTYQLYTGQVNSDGTINYSALQAGTYNNLSGSYIVPFDTYSATAGVSSTDKINTKIAKVILYSIQNPLVYMIPSTYAPSNTANRNMTNGTDWVSNHTEPNLAADRWGRSDKKSPFDPCPEGWRVPDIVSSSPDIIINEANSPWSKEGVIQTGPHDINSIYKGTKINSFGYVFNDDSYKIGNYPFVGIRGARNVAYGTAPNHLPHASTSGLWTSSLMCNYLGRANAFMFDTYYNDLTVHETNIDPSFTMNCRCVKIKKDSNGDETGPILDLPVDEYSTTPENPNDDDDNDSTNLSVHNLSQSSINDIIVYPNPVADVLHIKTSLDGDINYEIFNLNGSVVNSGMFVNKMINISELKAGVYLLNVNKSNNIYRIIKR